MGQLLGFATEYDPTVQTLDKAGIVDAEKVAGTGDPITANEDVLADWRSANDAGDAKNQILSKPTGSRTIGGINV